MPTRGAYLREQGGDELHSFKEATLHRNEIRMDAQGLLWVKLPDAIPHVPVATPPDDLEPSAEFVADTLQPLAVIWSVLLPMDTQRSYPSEQPR